MIDDLQAGYAAHRAAKQEADRLRTAAPGQDVHEAVVDALMDAAIRKAFEMGWTTRNRGMTLSDALALYDRTMDQ